MNYSLGNMLSNGGALNPDGLALDLQFAADKTLTARRGPTPTFTRASTATFVGSNGLIQTAAINAPRFDHDPVTLASRGLLIEESRTNLMLRSDDFGNATWTKINATVTTNQETAPNGSLTADKIVENASTALPHGLSQFITVVANTTYRFSCFFKAGERSICRIAQGSNIAVFNLSNGTIISTSGTPDANIVSYGNGWYRCSINTVSATTGMTVNCLMQAANYIGDGVSGLFIWGAQIEVGSFPTSYIPTTTASVVRSADVCSITGSDFSGFYNQSEGTLLTNAFTPASGDRTVLATDDNTANEMIRLRTEGTNPFFKVTDGGSEVVAIDAGTVSANTLFKLIGAYKANDFASSINGGSAVTDTVGTIPTVDRMRIGAGQAGNTMCGCVSSVRYFKKRLPDSKLQSLTA